MIKSILVVLMACSLSFSQFVVQKYTKEQKASYASFAAYLTSTGTTKTSFEMKENITIIAPTTIPENVDIRVVANGAKFTGSGTLTIKSMSAKPNSQVFDTSLTVLFDSVACPNVYAGWFGSNKKTISRAAVSAANKGLPLIVDRYRYPINGKVSISCPGEVLAGAKFTSYNNSSTDTLEFLGSGWKFSDGCFGDSLTVIGLKGEVRPEWWGKTGVALQSAINACTIGGTVVSSDSINYSSTININKNNIKLICNKGSKFYFNNDTTAHGILVSGKNVSIDGINMQGNGVYKISGLFSNQLSLINITGSNCKITNATIINPNQTGIKIDTSGRGAIIDGWRVVGGPYFDTTGAHPIGTNRQHTAISFRADSISILNGVVDRDSATLGSVIEGVVANAWSNGTYTLHSKGSKIQNNTIKWCWDHAIYANLVSSDVSHNHCYHGGIKLQMPPNDSSFSQLGLTVTNNFFDGSNSAWMPLIGDYGLDLNDVRNCIVSKNEINNAVSAGIRIGCVESHGSPAFIYGNKFEGNIINTVVEGASDDVSGFATLSDETLPDRFYNNSFVNNSVKNLKIRSDSTGRVAAFLIEPNDSGYNYGNSFSMNQIDSIDQYAFYLQNLKSSLINGNIANNLWNANGTNKGAIQLKNCKRIKTTGNIFDLDSVVHYAYREETSSDSNEILWNTFYKYRTAQIRPTGFGTHSWSILADSVIRYSNRQQINDVTSSTSSSTGALVVTGGLGAPHATLDSLLVGASGSRFKELKIIDGSADTLSVTVGAKTWKFLPVANQ